MRTWHSGAARPGAPRPPRCRSEARDPARALVRSTAGTRNALPERSDCSPDAAHALVPAVRRLVPAVRRLVPAVRRLVPAAQP
ncbi:hypothetical protein GCM10010515_29070 [Streptomyces fructofermentans]|uniref:Uncharacterized protein n=1 Tax=Streptomyces fructofermentans TaxID=152141 RepID=A0A918KDC8_9ACTN|nr:hypothetical protein GCM10010515_29070 [Streptomyces fructofermentans]